MHKYSSIHVNTNMEGYQDELKAIRELLKAKPRGLTISEISAEININRNSVAKYLDVLLISGHLEKRQIGPAKVYTLSNRVPISAMMDLSSDMIMVLDNRLNIIQANENLLDLIGLTADEVLEKSFSSMVNVIFPDSDIYERANDALEGVDSAQDIYLLHDGSTKYLYVKLVPTTFEDGRQGVTVILDDVTEQRRAEAAIRESQNYLKTILDALANGVIVINGASNKIVDINTAALDVLGSSRDEVVGTLRQQYSPKGVEMGTPLEDLDEVVDREERTILRPSGEELDVMVTVVPVELQGEKHLLESIIDITDIREAKEALRRRDAILNSLSFATEKFLKAEDYKSGLNDVLERLGEATGVSRICVFQNDTTGSKAKSTDLKYEWAAVGIRRLLEGADHKDMAIEGSELKRWFEAFSDGIPISGHVDDLPDAEKEFLTKYEVKSVVMVPIFAGSDLWGHIEFDECNLKREWSEAELDALKTAADLLGMAVEMES